MKPARLLVFVIAAFFSIAEAFAGDSIPSDEENPRFLLAGQADAAIAEGDYDAAAARLLEAISISPGSPDNVLLLSNLGMVYSCLNRDSLALATLDEALLRAPAMKTVLANRARVLLKMGRDREAFDAFGHIIEDDSLNTDARYYHGMIALYGGDAVTAEEDFNVLLSLDPEGTDTAQALSVLYSLTGRNRKAVPYFERLIAVEPSPEYYAGLAGCELAEGRLSEASAAIGRGLELYPDDAELYYYRAWLNRDLYREHEARDDARRAVELGVSRRRAEALFSK